MWPMGSLLGSAWQRPQMPMPQMPSFPQAQWPAMPQGMPQNLQNMWNQGQQSWQDLMGKLQSGMAAMPQPPTDMGRAMLAHAQSMAGVRAPGSAPPPPMPTPQIQTQPQMPAAPSFGQPASSSSSSTSSWSSGGSGFGGGYGMPRFGR